MEVVLRSIMGIVTVIDGDINILTYNGNLPCIECDDDINILNKKYIESNLNIKNLYLKQCYTFCEKVKDKLIVSVLYMDIINFNSIKLSDEFNFLSIKNTDKNIYIDKLIECLKEKLVLYSEIKKVYPSVFILPDLQKLYENLLDKKYDRRNFRKRLIKLNVIEDLEKSTKSKTGRPAKLYKFKELKEDKNLFGRNL